MAKTEHDRENLLRDAVALVERAELLVDDYCEPTFIGFRRDGAASFYFGPDAVYHFNSSWQLRRGYHQGKLIKAEKGKLVSLLRQRSENQVALIRSEMTDEEMRHYLNDLRTHLNSLRTALREKTFQRIGQVPPDQDIIARIADWLDKAPGEIAIARGPRTA